MHLNPSPISTRGRALEEQLFAKLESERAAGARDAWRQDALRDELGRELELADDLLLDELLGLGVTPETAPAFEALPLLEVAWADGHVDPEERWEVLTVATAFGLELGRAAHAQVELWVERPPAREILDAWYAVAAARREAGRSPHCARRLVAGMVQVAAAAGGLLGFRPISGTEQAVIDRVRRTTGSDGENHRVERECS